MIAKYSELATNTTSWTTQFYRAARTRLTHVVGLCLALVVLGAVDAANAQVRTYARSDIERFIRDVERSAQEFERDLDTWLDRSNIDGQTREDVYNREVNELTSSLRSLRQNFNRRNDWWVARNDAQRVIKEATDVNTVMNAREVRGGLNRQWRTLRTNINTLADAFNLPQVGTNFGGIQPYPEYGGSNRACSVTGTFRGYTNSGETELTISSNGSATARALGHNALYNGRCTSDVLYFDWGTFRLQREGRNNIATVEIGNERNRTSYRRTSGGGIGTFPGTFPEFPDRGGSVPNWAVGTFRGQTGNGESELTISSNGVATARSLNSNDYGTGRYDNGRLRFDWGTFDVERVGNGIRTIDRNNRRNTTTYQRVGDYQSPINPGYQDGYSVVPSWAVGTFQGSTNEGESEITIRSNGEAFARSLNTGASFNGRYANGVLSFDWGSFRLVQENNGFRTVELNNSNNRTSYRRVN